MLRLYVDSADREVAEPLLATGLFHGLTTNPTLLQRAAMRSGDWPQLYEWATAVGAQEVFFQAWGEDTESLLQSAARLQEIGPGVVIKVPATRAGAVAAAQLVLQGHRVLLTAVYSAPQGLVAAAAGVHYVAPYLGRMGDAGKEGMAEVIAMQRAMAGVASSTEVLVASVRDLGSVVALAQHGVSCFALSPGVAELFFADPLTAEATAVFEAAAQETSR